MACLGTRQLAGFCGVVQSPTESLGWHDNYGPPLRFWPPPIRERARPKQLARASGKLQTSQVPVLGRNQEEPLQPEGNRSTASDSGPGPSHSGEAEDPHQEGSKDSQDGDYYRKHNLVIACVIDSLRPLLERLGLSIVQPRHGLTKASFAIVEQRALAASMQGNTISCLPVHVIAGHMSKRSGQVTFPNSLDHPGLVLLVHTKTSLRQPFLSECMLAALLFTGRSIMSRSIGLRPGAPSKYAPHKLGTVEELAHTTADFASRVFGNREGPSRTEMKSGAILSVSDVLPLPTLQQVTTPAAATYRKAMEAYNAFFGADGLLASPTLQGLLTANQKQGSRSGYFMLNFRLESKAVQLTAHGCRGSLESNGGVLFRTIKGGQSNACRWWKPFQAGEVDLAVCYTPCLRGIYLVPDFVLAQSGVRSTEESPGQVTLRLRPYGGGWEKTRLWNRFLVDCTAPEDVVYARCRAILALAAEGKAKGWEAMPRAEDLSWAPVTLPPPQHASKQRKKQSS